MNYIRENFIKIGVCIKLGGKMCYKNEDMNKCNIIDINNFVLFYGRKLVLRIYF